MKDPNHHSTPEPLREIIIHGFGGWLSGPCADTEPVPAEHVRAGDVLILDDGVLAEVDDVRLGWYWFAESHEPGVAVGWKAVTGQSSGVLFRRGSDVLARIAR